MISFTLATACGVNVTGAVLGFTSGVGFLAPARCLETSQPSLILARLLEWLPVQAASERGGILRAKCQSEDRARSPR